MKNFLSLIGSGWKISVLYLLLELVKSNSQLQLIVITPNIFSQMSIIFLALVENLLLVFTLNQYSYNLGFINLKCQLTKSGQVITTAYKKNNLYILDTLPFIPEYIYIVTTNNINTLIKSTNAFAHHAFTTSTSSSTGTITTWHCYLGHIIL